MGNTDQSRSLRRIAAASLVAGCLVQGGAVAAGDETTTTTQDVILARKVMMNSIEEYVNRINWMISAREINLSEARGYADTVSVMLMAFPHLFPPSSNQWKEDAERDPVTDTMASPDIWLRYPQFYEMAATASKTAYDMSRADNEEDLKSLHRALGVVCDLCHSLYLKE
jgi:cytochrome c556